jgi:hypothetical protein
MGNPSEQYGEIAKLQKLKALRNARDFGATEAQVATGFQKITGNPIDAVRNKYQADPNVVKQVNRSIGFTQPAVKPATTTPSQVARTGTGIYMGGQELKKQIGGGVITDPSRANPLGMQYQQMQGAGEYGQATNAIGTRAGSNKVVNVDPNVAAAYNRPEVGQRTSGGGIYLGKASEQPERQSTPLSALPGNRYNELMSKWREASGPYNPREREATRVAQARQAAQTEQANVAGEREAGIRQIEAEQKAKGEIGKATEAQRGAMELAKQQGVNAKDAATIRAEVGSEGIDAKAIIAGLQSEDENVRKLASEKFMKMFSATAGANQASISVDDARAQAKAAGKKQFKLGGKVYDV